MALTQVKAAGLAADLIDETKLADDSIDSEHYNDGSIDHAHLANDAVDGDNIADDSIDSEHYVDGSVDHAHLANDCVDGDNIADDAINSEHYVDASIDHQHLADDCVDGDNIADNSVGLAHMAGGTDGQIITYDASGDPVAVGPGTDGQVLTSTGAGSPPAFEDAAGGGISEMDHWSWTSAFSGNAAPLSSNLARNSQAGSLTKVGTGMTVSSGVWTFPSTGYWEIAVRAKTNASSNNHYTRIYTEHSSDGGSNWVESSLSYGGTGGNDGGNSFFEGIHAYHIHKISNVSNDKVRLMFYVSNSGANWTATAAADGGANGIFFKKLADV